jgi:hypothetical protein
MRAMVVLQEQIIILILFLLLIDQRLDANEPQ